MHFALLFASHVPIALVVERSGVAATLYGLAALGFGLWAALSGRFETAIYTVSYIVGAEVLWRMSDSLLFWEHGKYAVSLILIVLLLRTRQLRAPALPLFYFLLLLPAAALTAYHLVPNQARQYISFNLSGPFVLLLSAWFFSRTLLTEHQLKKLMLWTVAPLIGIGTLTAYFIWSGQVEHFGTESNMEVTGGFSPNQVSAVLGLGVMFCLLYFIRWGRKRSHKVVLIVTAIFLAAQSALTFSRGGLVTAIAGLCAGSIFMFRDGPSLRRLTGLAAVVLIFVSYIVLPRLNALTEGALLQRFTEATLSNRGEILVDDLQVWMDRPFVGVGPGLAKDYRELRGAAAHTEYTRMLAEHGLLGVISLVLLGAFVLKSIIHARASPYAGLIVATLAWSLLFMVHSAMRVAAPGFLIGLAAVAFTQTSGQPSSDAMPSAKLD